VEPPMVITILDSDIAETVSNLILKSGVLEVTGLTGVVGAELVKEEAIGIVLVDKISK
jgi:hypothetical protein